MSTASTAHKLKDPLMADDVDSVLISALQRATEVQTEGLARLEVVENQVEHLEETFQDRMGRLEDQMGTTNAHLDNIAREAAITNDFLRKQDERDEAERARQQKLEDDQLERAREDKKANRDLLVKTSSELWSIFKQPLGYLVAAGIAYAAYMWFGVSQPIQPPQDAALVEDAAPAILEDGE